jgi:chromosomal replication initiation ATPase DnaA
MSLDYSHVCSLPPTVMRPIMTPRALITGEIIRRCADDHGLTVARMLDCSNKTRPIARARFDCMARLRDLRRTDGAPRFSLPQIGRMLGGLDHTSVLHGLRRWAEINAMREAAE